jgi:hypothetical protein
MAESESNIESKNPAPSGKSHSPQSYPSPEMQQATYSYSSGVSYPPVSAVTYAQAVSPPPLTHSQRPSGLPPLRPGDITGTGYNPVTPVHSIPSLGGHMNGGYAVYSPIYSHHLSHSMMSQPLPHHGTALMLSGGRQKKEVKRRTKTGCMTCRKRRIKVRDDGLASSSTQIRC